MSPEYQIVTQGKLNVGEKNSEYRNYLLLPWRRQWQPTPVLLPGKPHGRRSLVGCSLWGRKESDTTERLHFHFSHFTFIHWRRKWQPSCQCSCLENPRDRGAWWAAIFGVAQSQTQLKRLSSSNSKQNKYHRLGDLNNKNLFPHSSGK